MNYYEYEESIRKDNPMAFNQVFGSRIAYCFFLIHHQFLLQQWEEQHPLKTLVTWAVKAVLTCGLRPLLHGTAPRRTAESTPLIYFYPIPSIACIARRVSAPLMQPDSHLCLGEAFSALCV